MANQSQKYLKRAFPFGRIAVAYFKSGETDSFNITYWGNDNTFEQVIVFSGQVIEQNAGHYGRNGIRFNEVAICKNINNRQPEISDVIDACLSQ